MRKFGFFLAALIAAYFFYRGKGRPPAGGQ
jgi:hypothetical protein